MVDRRFRPCGGRIDRRPVPVDHRLVDAVLDVGGGIGSAPQALQVALVLGEQERLWLVAHEVAVPHERMRGSDPPPGVASERGKDGPRVLRMRPPGVAEPEGGQEVQVRRFRAPVVDRDPRHEIVRGGLRVLDLHVPVAVAVEGARIQQLVLQLVPVPRAIGGDQVIVRERGLRVFVQQPHVGMGRRAVQIEVALLDVLAVVPLAVGEAEETLLEDGILTVPERESQAEQLLVVRETGDAVLAPAIRPRPRLVVGEAVPGVAVGALVLPDRPPLALAQIRPPSPPGHPVVAGLK